jgi:hypothetical protein
MTIKGSSCEVSEENEQYVIVNWEKVIFDLEAENLVDLCFTVGWKA